MALLLGAKRMKGGTRAGLRISVVVGSEPAGRDKVGQGHIAAIFRRQRLRSLHEVSEASVGECDHGATALALLVPWTP
jgi:hypothetical protein